MAKISQMKPGQVLYEIVRGRMGHTTMTRGALYSVYVKEVDPDGQWVVASWNGNPPRKYSQRQADKWRVSKPEPKSRSMGMPSY